jgi:hypothetical protein
MMKRHVLSLVVVPFLVVACGGSSKPPAPPPEPPPASAAPPPEPAPAEADAGAEAAAEPAQPETPPAPAALNKPASESTIGGTSISSVDPGAVVDAVKKMKWAGDSTTAGGGTAGQYEDIKFDIQKGKDKGFVEIVRPAQSPTASDTPVKAPADMEADLKKDKAAIFYDDSADVLVAVSVDKKAYLAKQILGKLVKKAKAKPAAHHHGGGGHGHKHK